MNPGWGSHTDRRYSAIGRLNEWFSAVGVTYYSFCNVFPRPGQFKFSDIDLGWLARVVVSSGQDTQVFALGNTASRALSKIGAGHVMLPHPSYRNRKLNSKSFENSVLQSIKFLIYS